MHINVLFNDFFGRFRTSGISSVSTCLKFLVNWIWPRERCSGEPDYWRAEYSQCWAQAAGTEGGLGSIHRAADGRFVLRANTPSLADSSSDEGGFLPRRARASWRRPLVPYPSQLSLRSEGSGQSARLFFYPPVLLPAVYSPPRFQASSPAAWSPWSPVYFSDLSSVRQASSGDRSFPTPPTFVRLRSVHQRYSQELPSLRAIHEETRALRSPYTRSPRSPRSPRRLARSAPDLARRPSHEPSPESRSSSSGFGSKNTSQQNRSSSSGEWRPPPYRPPPPPPLWLELALLPGPGSPRSKAPGGDTGSVDAHYEFDPATPTPTASTPTERPTRAPLRTAPPDMEARVRAMKEEFQEFRRRQAQRHRSRDLQSVC